jgi:hypothetical protein
LLLSGCLQGASSGDLGIASCDAPSGAGLAVHLVPSRTVPAGAVGKAQARVDIHIPGPEGFEVRQGWSVVPGCAAVAMDRLRVPLEVDVFVQLEHGTCHHYDAAKLTYRGGVERLTLEPGRLGQACE